MSSLEIGMWEIACEVIEAVGTADMLQGWEERER